MKFIWLDDIRTPVIPTFITSNASCIWAKTAEACIQALIENLNDSDGIYISLDHDLGDNTACGTAVTDWIELQAYNAAIFTDLYCSVHSDNPVGKSNMLAGLVSAQTYSKRVHVHNNISL